MLETSGSRELTQILDDSGDVLLGVSPEKCARWALSAWQEDELIGLGEVILVGDDLSLKRHEKRLLAAGNRVVKVNGERSRMYWASEDGLIQLINIKGHRDPLALGLQKKRRWCSTRFFWHYKYSSRLKWFLIKEIHLGVSSAELWRLMPQIPRGAKATKEKYSDIYYSMQVKVGLRLLRSMVVPVAMTFILYDKLRYRRVK